MYNYFGAYFPEHKCRQETYFRMINLHLMYIFISIGFFNSNLFAKLNNVLLNRAKNFTSPYSPRLCIGEY